MTEEVEHRWYWGRADERLYQGRLPPDAMRTFRSAVRLGLLSVAVGVVALPIGFALISMKAFGPDTVVVVAASGVSAILIVDMVALGELRRARTLTGAYYGLTRRESRPIIIWTPEDFDRTLGYALDRKEDREARNRQPGVDPPAPMARPVPRRGPRDRAALAQLKLPVSTWAIIGLIASFAVFLHPLLGWVTWIPSAVGYAAIARRERRGMWLVIPGLTLSIGALFIYLTIPLLAGGPL